jgi:GNAT superfamily N-acetyltransferase
MPLRLARHGDLPVISSIFAAAFYNEEVTGDWMHPYRHQYPLDYAGYWIRKMREKYWDYGNIFMVSYFVKDGEKPDGQQEEVVTGTAIWSRQGLGWERTWGIFGKWDVRRIFKRIARFFNRTSLILWPNRAADPKVADIETLMFPFISHLWSGERANCWNLEYLAVAPEYQNQGYGRQLARWGLQQAETEGVCASVISADKKETFYQRCGFHTLVGRATDGDGNPLAGRVKGGAIFFTDAEEKAIERETI